jgi:ribonuclease HI
MTCNEAEYTAVLLALETRLHGEKLLLRTDSNLVVKQLDPNDPWRINFEHLKLLNSLVLDVIRNTGLLVEFEYVPRDNNLAGRYIEGRLVCDKDIVVTQYY